MRTDTDAIDEKVSDIRVDGRSIGGCNPDGEENQCTFYDCSSNEKDLGDHLSDTVLRSNSEGEMTFEIEYSHFVDDNSHCHFDGSKQQAVVSITLDPIEGNFIGYFQLFSFYTILNLKMSQSFSIISI